jgi:hypothetical protein
MLLSGTIPRRATKVRLGKAFRMMQTNSDESMPSHVGRYAHCSIRFALSLHAVLVICVLCLPSCSHFKSQFRPSIPAVQLPNPLEVPVAEPEMAWNELVDAVDDFFPIAREERVRVIGGVATEGRIETKVVTGATRFEFFRRDATPGFERWLGTFQSIRRQAEVRVTATVTGYAIHVVVRKELEDVDRPEMSLVGSAVQRHDGTLVRPGGSRVGGAVSLGWIPIGRDIALEQTILAAIQARMTQAEIPPAVQTLPSTHRPR